ncbi:MAG: glycosyltransferase family 39 protein [Bryobacterales bacterium]|nr:glycosyltransferase family 39 protein [Bryobacterales bacterium]
MPFVPRLVLLLLLSYLLYLNNLGGVGLLGPDEPRYAWIGRAMAWSGDWITPQLWGEAWFEKPPLLYWLTSLGFRAGLGNDTGPRLPVALLSLLFLGSYYRLLREQFENQAALYSTAMLGTCAGWLAYSHIGVTDLPLAATFAAGMLLCLRWIETGETSRLPLAGICFGLAVLAKGLVPAVLAVPLLWFAWGRLGGLWKLLLPALATAAPWYVLCYARNGQAFWDEFIVRHHFERFISSSLQHVQPFWFYVPVLFGGLFPWTFVLALLRRPSGITERFLYAWAGFGFLFFSMSVNKLPGYLLPLLPAICALAGVGLAQAQRATPWLAATGAMMALVPTAAAILPDAVDHSILRTSPPFGYAILMPLFAGLILLAARWRGRTGAVAAMVALIAGGIVYLQTVAYPALDEKASARGAWLRLAGRDAEVCLDNPRRAFRYQVDYYAARTLPDCETDPKPVRLP